MQQSRPFPEPTEPELPEIIPMDEQLDDQPNIPLQFKYTGLIAQTEQEFVRMPISPSEQDLKLVTGEKGLYPEDKIKYKTLVEELIKRKRLNLREDSEPSIEDLLKFALGAIWITTGEHNEEAAEEMIATSVGVLARDLVDIDNPPITKCSFFNSAFVYIFEAACRYYKLTEVLSRYQFIAINRPTHLYLGLVSRKDAKYRISALDPYHTGTKSDIEAVGLDLDRLYSRLDRTIERSDELIPNFLNVARRE